MRIAALLMLAALLAACSGGSDDPPDPTPAATRSPEAATATPTTDATATRETPTSGKTITVGDMVPFPDDMALIVEVGCWQCDGPGALGRVYRNPTGTVRYDKLYDSVLGYAAASDGSVIFAARCTRGECFTLGPAPADAQTTIMRSGDGGVTWQDTAVLEGLYYVIGLDTDGVVLAGPFDPAGGENQRYLLLPSSTQPTPPAGAASDALFPIDRVTLAWWSEDARRLLAPDGGVLLDVGSDHEMQYGQPLMSEGGRILVSTLATSENEFTFSVGDAGAVEHYDLSSPSMRAGVWLDEAAVFGNATMDEATRPESSHGYFPAIIDLTKLIASPIIEGFLDEPLRNGRNQVIAFQRGPFLRVNTPDDCLNLRETPGEGRVIGCAANGVLLRDHEEETVVEGVSWLRVSTPGEPEAIVFVAAEFVER